MRPQPCGTSQVVRPAENGSEPTNLEEKPTKLGGKPPNLEALPPELAAQVKALAGRRVSADNIRGVLLALCSIRAYTIDELVGLLGKNRDYMMHAFIRPMVRSGELAMRYPESPNHPYQAYVVPSKGKSD